MSWPGYSLEDTTAAEGLGVPNAPFRSGDPSADAFGTANDVGMADDFGTADDVAAADDVGPAEEVGLADGVTSADGVATGGYGSRAYTSMA